MSKVEYDGEYVLTKSGCKDFGEITKDIALIIKKFEIRLYIQDNEKSYFRTVYFN